MGIIQFASKIPSVLFCLFGVLANSTSAITTRHDLHFSGGQDAPTSGAFTYDDVAEVFTQFDVIWNGADIDITGSANSPVTQGSCPLFTGPQVFQVLTTGGVCNGLPLVGAWMTFPPNPPGNVFSSSIALTFLNANGDGPLIGGEYPDMNYVAKPSSGAFSVTSVPEPSSWSLLLLGGLFIAALRFMQARASCLAKRGRPSWRRAA